MFIEWPEWESFIPLENVSEETLSVDSEPGIYAVEALTIPNSAS